MHVYGRLCVLSIGIGLAWGADLAVTHRIDGTLPNGADCPAFGTWDADAATCWIVSGRIEPQQWLLIESATVEITGTLTNEGLLENRGVLVNRGFLDNTNDMVNSWSGTLVNHGQFFSHFMYNFGGLTNTGGGTIEFELHLENNAPMTNHGHIDIVGNYINIPQRTLANMGSIHIAATGTLTNGGRLVHTGRIDNFGSLYNEAELILHCDGVLTGNPPQGQLPAFAQGLDVGSALLEWCPLEGSAGYDVVEGDLVLLRAGGGDYATATTGCTADGVADVSWSHGADPPPGQGAWYLVRANGVAGADFETVFSSQSAPRTPGIAASGNGCP